MTSEGRISGKATWVRVSMYHNAFIHFYWKTVLYKQNVNFYREIIVIVFLFTCYCSSEFCD